jgi:hypothetical protein
MFTQLYRKKNIAAIVLPILLTCIVSCESAIEDAENFIPNKSPMITNATAVYYNPSALPFDNTKLISHMTFDITVEAADPENQTLTYEFSSDYGSFSAQTDSSTGSTVKFVTGLIKGGDNVVVRLKVSDTKNGATIEDISIGTGKAVPIISITPTSQTLAISTSGTVTATADCDGFFQVVVNDTATADEMHFDGENTSFVLADKDVACTLSIPAFTTSGTHKVWILFLDYLYQESTPALCTITVGP